MSRAGPEATAWSDAAPRARADVLAGKPLVTRVIVPLCDNALINCGSSIAGKPRDLAHNVYWGAAFGQRRFFERAGSGWETVAIERPTKTSPRGLLERAVFRRTISRGPWGGAADATATHYVVLDAYDGEAIDAALADFFRAAAKGGAVSFMEGGEARTLRVHVVGWAGHDRLMDGVAPPQLSRGEAALPSFAMACSSESYFAPPLRAAGSRPLVMTATLMAPEGYVVEAIAHALGDNASSVALRAAAVAAYAKWQKLPARAASSVFAPAR